MEMWIAYAAVVWSVGEIEQGMEKDRRERRDVELHKRLADEQGAVYWGAGWTRYYNSKPMNGYLYISGEGLVKYRAKVEKIIRKSGHGPQDRKFIPECRKEWIKEKPTWIKITEIEELTKPVDPTSMIKWVNHEPIKSARALQSAVKIVDEFWE